MRDDILEQAQEIRTSIDSVTGTIVLYYLPHELIGQYFEEVT